MRRRGFLQSLAALPLIGALKKTSAVPLVEPAVEVCELCGKPGHKAESGTIRPKPVRLNYQYPILGRATVLGDAGDWDFYWHIGEEESCAMWCENAPVDWTVMEKVGNGKSDRI